MYERPGGKAVNVARVLGQLGVRTTVAGFVGGTTGRRIDAALTASGYETRWVWIDGETRRCVANPVGAGDAVVAALVDASLRGWSWPERLSHAAAATGAAVAAPVAGEIDAGVYGELRGRVLLNIRRPWAQEGICC